MTVQKCLKSPSSLNSTFDWSEISFHLSTCFLTNTVCSKSLESSFFISFCVSWIRSICVRSESEFISHMHSHLNSFFKYNIIKGGVFVLLWKMAFINKVYRLWNGHPINDTQVSQVGSQPCTQIKYAY